MTRPSDQDTSVVNEEDLDKSIGDLSFPQLGIHSVYSYPKTSTSPQQSLSSVSLAHQRKPAGFERGYGFNAVDYNVNFEHGAYPQHSRGAASPGKSFSDIDEKGRPEKSRYIAFVEGGTSIPDPSTFNAVREHEGQHSVFHLIDRKFGEDKRKEVAKQLFGMLRPEHQEATTKLAQAAGYDKRHPYFHEEAILQPVNYLMSEEERKKAPQLHDTIKRAWKEIREKAKLVEAPVGKSEDLSKGSLQSKHPFDPTAEDTSGHGEIRDWQMGWAQDRSQIPHMEGEARFRALHKLHGATRARRGPTGEREFLLWRGHGPDMDVSGTHAVTSDRTGWTPNIPIAAGFSHGGHMTGAWVPESAIVSVPKQLGQLKVSPYASPDAQGRLIPKGANEMAPEYEVVVAPAKMEIAKVVPKEVARNTPMDQLTNEKLLGKSEEDLEKNIGFLTFPKLGVHQLPTMPYTGGSPKAEMIHFGEDAGYSKGQMRYTHELRGPTDPKDRKLHGYVKSGSTMTMPRGTQVNLETYGTAAHEGQHSAFAKVGQVNSVAAQMRLARFLHDQLNPQEKDALQQIASRSGYTKPPEGQRFKQFDYYEEAISSLQNYLQDKSFRNGVHEDLLKDPLVNDTHHGRIYPEDHPFVAKYPDRFFTHRTLHDTAKGAWRKLMDVAPHVEFDRGIRDFVVKRPEMVKSEESAKKRKVVASVAVFNPQGKMLWGLRNDTKKFTMPGGHLEEGEKPLKGAIRELFEEAGLKPTDIESLGNEEVDSWDGKSKILVHAFKAMCDGKPHSKNDPDEECDRWDWVALKDGKLPEEIASKLHSPKNVTLKLLGLQDWEDMSKAEDPLVKAIANLAPGKLIGKRDPTERRPSVSYTYDYSHILPEHARNGEYSMELEYTPSNPDMPHGDGLYVTHLKHNGKSIGVVMGEHYRDRSAIDTHSNLNEPYRGKGFGKALYTAALAHAYHVLHAREVEGQPLSEEASHVHSSLARQHGMDYKPSFEGKTPKGGKVYSHLGYTIKQEEQMIDTLNKFEAILEQLTKGQKTTLTSDATVTDIGRAPKHETDLNFYRITPEVVKEYAQYGREGTLKGAQYVSSPGASIGSSPTVAFDNPEDLHTYIKEKYEPFIVKNVLPSNGSTVLLAPIPIRSMAHDNGHRYLNLDHMHGVSVAQDRRYRVPFYYTVAKDQAEKGYKHPMFAPLISEYKPGYEADSHHLRITDGNGRSVSARTAGATHMLSYVQMKPEHVPSFLRMIHETTNDPELHVKKVMGAPELPSEFHIHQIPDLVGNIQKSETLTLLNRIEAALDKLV